MLARHTRAAVVFDAASGSIRPIRPRLALAPPPAKARAATPPPGSRRPERHPILWASVSMPVRSGRVLGVRLRAEGVQVACIANGEVSLKWVPAASVLTSQDVKRWKKLARFEP